MVEERVRLFLAARLQFLMWGSAHRPRQTAHMNYVCLSLLLYVSLWLIFEKSFWQSSHRSVFWIVKSSGRSLWFFSSFPFFSFSFFLLNFIQDLSSGLVCTRWGWGFQTTTGNQVVCTDDRPNCKHMSQTANEEKVGGTQKIASEDEDVRKVNSFSNLICWIQMKDARSPMNKWPIDLLISIDPGSSTDTDIDWWPVLEILLIVSLKKKKKTDDKRIWGIRGEAKLYDPNGRKWKFPPPLNVGLHCAELCATIVARDDAEDICITSVLS